MMRSFINRRVAIAIVALTLLLAGGLSAFSQRNPAANKELPLKQLLQLPGKVLSEAKSARPNGDLRLTGYRIEEVSLPQNLNVEIRGQQVSVNKAFRVTVQGGPFPVRALPAVIWIDDQRVGYGVENEELSEITAITLDRDLLREGATISLSYGEDKQGRVKLPEKLKLSGAR